MWTDSDTSTLRSVFDYIWFIWTSEFQVLGFTTSFWKLAVTCFAILLVFKIARGLFEI